MKCSATLQRVRITVAVGPLANPHVSTGSDVMQEGERSIQQLNLGDGDLLTMEGSPGSGSKTASCQAQTCELRVL